MTKLKKKVSKVTKSSAKQSAQSAGKSGKAAKLSKSARSAKVKSAKPAAGKGSTKSSKGSPKDVKKSELKSKAKPLAPLKKLAAKLVTAVTAPTQPIKAKDKVKESNVLKTAVKVAGTPAPVVAQPALYKTPKKPAKAAGTGRSRRSLEPSCREMTCESVATTGDYCRMHYIKNWKRIKSREKILSEGKLVRFIEELVGKYPEKYLEAIRFDLSTDLEFLKVIRDLDLDETVEEAETETENTEAQAEEGIIDTIKRDIVEEEVEFF